MPTPEELKFQQELAPQAGTHAADLNALSRNAVRHAHYSSDEQGRVHEKQLLRELIDEYTGMAGLQDTGLHEIFDLIFDNTRLDVTAGS